MYCFVWYYMHPQPTPYDYLCYVLAADSGGAVKVGVAWRPLEDDATDRASSVAHDHDGSSYVDEEDTRYVAMHTPVVMRLAWLGLLPWCFAACEIVDPRLHAWCWWLPWRMLMLSVVAKPAGLRLVLGSAHVQLVQASLPCALHCYGRTVSPFSHLFRLVLNLCR